MTTATAELVTLDEHLDALLAKAPQAHDDLHAFWGEQFDLGLAWVHFPVGWGGLGLDPEYQPVVDERLRDAGVPSNFLENPIGIGMCAPTLISHGTEAQKRRYLRNIYSCDEIWCQLFSEPGAGSDVAGCSTRAVRDGDTWRVDGQKVWTSLGHLARWGLLLARTDPEVPKHKGLTMFVADMHAPGVDVRPLRQMTGEAEFNEVYFTGAEIPDHERVGAVGEGWRVALTTLMNERVAIGGHTPPRGSGPIDTAMRTFAEHPEQQSPVRRDLLMRLWIEAEVIRLTNVRAEQLRELGTPGPEGSISKLAQCEFNKRCYSFCVSMMGPDGTLYPSGYELRVGEDSSFNNPDARRAFLRSRANSIEGGTSEIMRNILGERVLGLPGDVRVDRELPWREVPRS
jgi:alkylation response protein AidB-like acyl-CoA dehydrogenase